MSSSSGYSGDLLVVTLLVFSAVHCSVGTLPHSEVDEKACSTKETCSACIQTVGCAWCSKPDDSGSLPFVRCKAYVGSEGGGPALEMIAWCPAEHIVWETSSMTIVKNDHFHRATQGDSAGSDAVQLRPQKVKMRLRVGEIFPLELQYSQAEDYPVDLYYLMDLSGSMSDDKETLSHLGDKIAYEMNRLTSNFRLGFGSFVDKRSMPFVSTVPKKLLEPCNMGGKPCAPPYSFKNHMPLTLNTKSFKDQVKRTRISGNLDSPEGGLDALMQVIVCQKEIGWRERARHLIVFSTDAHFHLAGDGKLAGVIEPNDGLCHLNEEMEYTHGLITDYPSISQINTKAQENNMNVIFAVVKKVLPSYEALSHRINGASSGQLSRDSSNVVNLIRDQYAKLVDSINLIDNATNFIRVQYYSSCLNNASDIRETRVCGGIRIHHLVNFTANIMVLKCPERKEDRHVKFHIKPQSLMESLEVDLEIICDCPCEQPGNKDYEESSHRCSGHGALQCGICACNDDYVGGVCQCKKGTTPGGDAEDISGCIPGGNASDPEAVICSKLGTCVCGVCDCNKRNDPNETISGKYCQCNNYSCKREEGKVCSGTDHGTCVCGVCECLNDWAGEACSCKNVTDTCIKPGATENDAKICSGNGDCICGNCQCHSEFSGLYCEYSSTSSGPCKELQDCVECQAFRSSGITVLDEKQCLACKFTVTIVKDLRKGKLSGENGTAGEISGPGMDDNYMNSEMEDDEEEGGHWSLCVAPDNAGCSFYFEYKYDNGQLIVRVQEEKECGTSDYVLGIVLTVVGSIVLAGIILLLVWKVLTTLHDKREYVKFEKERQMAKWDQGINPLYQQATTNFENPTYRK
ncbi:integrin beta-PS-like [Ischnura elegans]|uniref:integrin beta-PS-like n=1 Tax=Ischnura elegans TaxID=197161 RepID=UPI001ED890FE|nr:integrin beta-PS-like [Ischnura elegans]